MSLRARIEDTDLPPTVATGYRDDQNNYEKYKIRFPEKYPKPVSLHSFVKVSHCSKLDRVSGQQKTWYRWVRLPFVHMMPHNRHNIAQLSSQHVKGSRPDSAAMKFVLSNTYRSFSEAMEGNASL